MHLQFLYFRLRVVGNMTIDKVKREYACDNRTSSSKRDQKPMKFDMPRQGSFLDYFMLANPAVKSWRNVLGTSKG